jgi:hypothetical protein
MGDINYIGTIGLVEKGKPTVIILQLISGLKLSLPVYANNAAALAGGLVADDLYRTNGNPDTICVVH